MRPHLSKPGLRVLGVAESFKPGQRWSLLAGVVMRGDFLVDGIAVGRASVGGDDATASIASLFRRLRRNDVNVLMVSGCILSLYNIIDVDELAKKTALPVVCLTYKETSGIQGAIRRHFPEGAEKKLEAYRKLGERKRVALKTGKAVFIRSAGLTQKEAAGLLDAFTTQGAVPEPVKVARIAARALAAGL